MKPITIIGKNYFKNYVQYIINNTRTETELKGALLRMWSNCTDYFLYVICKAQLKRHCIISLCFLVSLTRTVH